MTAYSTDNILGVNLQQTYAPQSTLYPFTQTVPFEAGQVLEGTDGTSWLFCLASSAIAAGDVCSITSATSAAVPITTTNGALGNQVGVAVVAIASGSYGWLMRAGYCDTGLHVAYACSPNVQLATTATAGYIDDSTATGTKNISGIIITTTNTAATAAAVVGTLNFPVVTTTNA